MEINNSRLSEITHKIKKLEILMKQCWDGLQEIEKNIWIMIDEADKDKL